MASHAFEYIFLAAILGILIVLTLITFLKIKKNKQKMNLEKVPTPKSTISSSDIKAIAGDDVITTELDLARAYIEMNKIHLAKQILEHVKTHGNYHQQQESIELLNQHS